LFREALGEYLKGHWLEAEASLGLLLRHDPRDVEARLMLASVFRHTSRLPQARRQLVALSRLEGAEKWRTEITAELDLVGKLDAAGRGETASDSGPSELSQAA
jgi:hypothetical protein